jgi:organic hydroperoxide reductase OsmC/OhrA
VTVTASAPKPRPKSFRFSTNLEWTEGRSAILKGIEAKPELRIAPPPEFRGDPGSWSPEHLFVSAVDGCLLLTFAGLASKLGLHFVSYQSEAEGLLEWVDGTYAFTAVTLRPRIIVRDEQSISLAREILGRAHDSCLISNSIKAKVRVEEQIDYLQQ